MLYDRRVIFFGKSYTCTDYVMRFFLTYCITHASAQCDIIRY